MVGGPDNETLVLMACIVGAIGWAVIEAILWLFRHIDISIVWK